MEQHIAYTFAPSCSSPAQSVSRIVRTRPLTTGGCFPSAKRFLDLYLKCAKPAINPMPKQPPPPVTVATQPPGDPAPAAPASNKDPQQLRWGSRERQSANWKEDPWEQRRKNMVELRGVVSPYKHRQDCLLFPHLLPQCERKRPSPRRRSTNVWLRPVFPLADAAE